MNVSPALPILRASTMTTLGAARGKVVIMRTFDQLIEPPPAVPGWVATPWSLSEIANVGIGGFSAIEQDVGPFHIHDADLSWGIGRKRGYVGDLASKGADFDGKTLLFNIGGTEVRNDVFWFEPRTSIWTGWTTPGTAALLRDLGRDALPNELLGCVLMDHPGIAASLIKPVVKNYLAWSPQVTAAAPRTTRAPWLVPFDGLVYAFHEIDNGGGEIVYSTRPLSGGDWSPDESASGPSRTAGTSGPPSAVAVKTAWGPRLLVFSEGASNDGWLWLSIFDGISWGDPIQPRQPNGSAFGTRGAPGLAIVGTRSSTARHGARTGSSSTAMAGRCDYPIRPPSCRSATSPSSSASRPAATRR
jgi:hypothetical protein